MLAKELQVGSCINQNSLCYSKDSEYVYVVWLQDETKKHLESYPLLYDDTVELMNITDSNRLKIKILFLSDPNNEEDFWIEDYYKKLG